MLTITDNRIPALFFFLLTAVTLPLYSSSQYNWRPKACLPASGRVGTTAFSIGNKGYLIGGYNSAISAYKQVWEYDEATNTWNQKNDFPVPTVGSSSFVIRDTAYVGLGYDGISTYSNTFYRYDQANDNWVPVAAFPGAARYLAMQFCINNKGYVGCGKGAGQYNDFYEYEPITNTWTAKANFPGSPRQTGFGSMQGGYGFMGLGFANGVDYNDIYRYNPANNTWAGLPPFAGGSRLGVGAFVLNDTFYIVGGREPSAIFFDDCWRYDIGLNQWVQENSFTCVGAPVAPTSGFSIGNHGYVAGGVEDNLIFSNKLIEFSRNDLSFVQSTNVLGSDSSYCGNFSRILSTGNTCTRWSTGAIASQITVNHIGLYWATYADNCDLIIDTVYLTASQSINIGTDTAFCGDFSMLLTTGVNNTAWSTGAFAPQLSVTAPGIYWAKVSTNCGIVSDTIELMQYPVPFINAGADTFLCGLNTILLNAANTGSSYTWSNGSDNQSIIVNYPGIYIVTVTNNYGCSASDSVIINPRSVAVTVLSQNTGCGEANGWAEAIISNGGSPFNYLWSNGSDSAVITNLLPGTYQVNVMDIYGCQGMASVMISGSDSVIPIVAGNQLLCAGDTTFLCAHEGFLTYNWNNGSNASCITVRQPGNYRVTATGTGGCTVENNIVITGLPQPAVSVTVNGDTLTAYNGITYQWFYNGAIIPGATASRLIAGTAGNFAVQITDSNGCSAISNNIYIIASIQQLTTVPQIEVFPNPLLSGPLHILIPADVEKLTITTYTGEAIYETNAEAGLLELNMSLLPGVYFIKFMGPRRSLFKLVKL